MRKLWSLQSSARISPCHVCVAGSGRVSTAMCCGWPRERDGKKS